jgi:hypothetical protein
VNGRYGSLEERVTHRPWHLITPTGNSSRQRARSSMIRSSHGWQSRKKSRTKAARYRMKNRAMTSILLFSSPQLRAAELNLLQWQALRPRCFYHRQPAPDCHRLIKAHRCPYQREQECYTTHLVFPRPMLPRCPHGRGGGGNGR